MPTFAYKARDQQGSVKVGSLEATTEDEVIATLQHRGLLVTSVAQKEELQRAAISRRTTAARPRMHGRVTVDDQVLLCQQLATLVDAGIPLMKSLEVVSAQVESRTLLTALNDVRQEVAAGRTLRDALAKHPNVFSSLWLNLVETGEASGHLSQSLQQLARHFELVQRLRNQTATALTYPVFLIGAAIIVLGVFVYWLIPKFTVIFASMPGMKLPALTLFMIALSHGARQYAVVIIGGVVAGGWLLRRYLSTASGRAVYDRLMLSIPRVRLLVMYVQLAEFFRGLATLLESGVPLLSGLEILARSSTNTVYGQAIDRVREFVKEGKSMAEPMGETELFPAMTVQMVQVGEEVGELAKMAERIARYYESHVEILIERVSRLFEPIAIVIMGMLVLVIVLSIFMPIIQMTSGGRM